MEKAPPSLFSLAPRRPKEVSNKTARGCAFLLAFPLWGVLLGCPVPNEPLDFTEPSIGVPDVQPTCSENLDCDVDEVCRAEQCEALCESDDDCEGLTCNAFGACVECQSNASCDVDERCTEGRCVFFCDAHGDCADEEFCIFDESLDTRGQCETRECNKRADCPNEQRCVDFKCVSNAPLLCEANRQGCGEQVGDNGVSVSVIQKCEADGMSITILPCGVDEVCVERAGDGSAECEAILCDANEMGCVDNATAFFCNATGTEKQERACGQNEYCELGICRSQRCTPTQSSCRDNDILLCDDVGAQQTVTSCLDENECSSPNGCQCTALGAPAEGVECVERNCVPGQKQCAANGVQTCLDDGSGFSAVQICELDALCTAGRCLPTPCVAGSSVCAQDVLLLCDDVGQYAAQDCSASQAFCQQGPAPDQARCEAQVCEPGTRSCSTDGRMEKRCDERGAAEIESLCDVDESCQDRVCSAKICQPDTTHCAGNAVVLCNENGQEETIVECASDSQCEAGICTTIAPLTVELTWSHPSANLDLVFAKGQICDANRMDGAQVNPNWGAPGSSDDDPYLDIVDDDGLGPEHLVWVTPQPGQYFLGIHFLGPTAARTVASLNIMQGDEQLMSWTIPMGEKDLFVVPVTVLQHDVIVDLSQLRLHGGFNDCRENCEHCTADESCPVEVGECLTTPLSARYCEQDSDCDNSEVCLGTCTPSF